MSTDAAAEIPVDPIFPHLHIRPPRGWLNDPNGACFIDSRYHVFFQWNPTTWTHGDIHWGHVSSSDLLHWDPEPIALRPRPGKIDSGGCWSGCVVDDDGVPTAVYSAVPGHAHDAQVVLARSDRTLREWAQDEVSQMAPPADKHVTDVRDPFVFTFDGHRYAIQGGGSNDGPPEILAYSCDDLTKWTALGTLLTYDDPVAAELAPAQIWECPNLVRIDGQWVLLLSLWQWVDGAHSLAGVRYLVGELSHGDAGSGESRFGGSGLRFTPRAGGVVDSGPTFYAPQVLGVQGRVLLWGWAWELGRTEAEVTAAGWAGVLTFPRELRMVGDRLVSQPAAELESLRTEPLAWQPGEPVREVAFEVVAAGPVALVLVDGTEALVVARMTAAGRILVDASMVEVFSDGSTMTTRAYPTSTSSWQLQTNGAQVEVYRLGL